MKYSQKKIMWKFILKLSKYIRVKYMINKLKIKKLCITISILLFITAIYFFDTYRTMETIDENILSKIAENGGTLEGNNIAYNKIEDDNKIIITTYSNINNERISVIKTEKIYNFENNKLVSMEYKYYFKNKYSARKYRDIQNSNGINTKNYEVKKNIYKTKNNYIEPHLVERTKDTIVSDYIIIDNKLVGFGVEI